MASLSVRCSADAKAAYEERRKEAEALEIALRLKIELIKFTLNDLKDQVINLRIFYPSEKLLTDFAEILNSIGVVNQETYKTVDGFLEKIQESVLKTAGELKAKIEASDKAETDKIAAAAKKAADKIIADAKAAAKKSTITCVKGKLIKKVSAVNPKCPSG